MISIISIFNKHEDFISLQYMSIKKHVKGEYEYIVFNNGSTEEQAAKIKKSCENLGINSIRITVNYDMSTSDIAGEALNKAFSYLLGKKVFKIDSDMFFISGVELSNLCNDHDLIYIETQDKFMWSAVFGINLKKIEGFQLDFRPNVIPNTDTFGQSCLLTEDKTYTRKKIFLYCILTEGNGIINGLINNDCRITLTDYQLTFNENNLYENLYEGIPSKYLEISKKMIEYKFPDPYHIDIITLDGVDIIIHFKSSNHDDIYRDLDYTKKKKNSLVNFLNDN
jgi:phosphoribosylformylglycinamidine (FGAM) synthase PurS component